MAAVKNFVENHKKIQLDLRWYQLVVGIHVIPEDIMPDLPHWIFICIKNIKYSANYLLKNLIICIICDTISAD